VIFKFKLTSQQLQIEWTNINEAILNKRRNWKKNTQTSATIDITKPIQDLNESQA
jgi:hypothetical protein